MRRTTLLLAALSLLVAGAPSSAPGAQAPDVSTTLGGGVHTVGGCALFPPDSPWNRRIDDRPVWRRSAAIVGRQAAGHQLHLDLGTTEDYYGIPVNVVEENQPLLPLQFGVDGEDYRDESDRGPVFVPADGAIEGGSTVVIGYVDNHGVSGDRVVDPRRLEGGRLSAHDHRADVVREFAVHRITTVRPA